MAESDEDVEVEGVDELGDEVLGALGGGELVPVLDVGVEVEVLGPLEQVLHLLGLDVEVAVVELGVDEGGVAVEGTRELGALAGLLGAVELVDELRLLRLLAAEVEVLEPLELGLSRAPLTSRCFLKYFSSRSSFLWW